ncbi:MAG: hypothetical protein LUC90_02660 [Lachnospiraceae bacterium]|nr:hypothetical protein [Lachnospiraceae bacterium]
MKKEWKRCVAAGLTAAFALSAAGCGGSSSESGSQGLADGAGTVNREYVFAESTLGDLNDFIGESGYINSIRVYDDIIYLVSEHNYDNGYSNHFSSWDMEGNQLSDVEVYSYTWETYYDVEEVTGEEASAEAGTGTEETQTAEAGTGTEEVQAAETGATEAGAASNEADVAGEDQDGDDTSDLNEENYIYTYWISPDGCLYYLGENSRYSDDWSYYESSSYLGGMLSDGTECFHVTTSDWGEEYEYMYFYDMDFSQEGKLVLWNSSQIFTLDTQGELLSVTDVDSSIDIYRPSFYYGGMPVFQRWNEDYTSSYYVQMDLATGQAGEEVEVMDTISNYSMFDGGNSGYDLILSGSGGLYGYHFGDEEAAKIMDFISSDLPTTSLSNVIFISEDMLLATYYDVTNYDQHFSLFTHVNPEDVPDRTQMVLAMYYQDTDVLEKVIAFNKSSEEHQIVVNYYSGYATNEDYLAGATKLNNEIVAGDIPDMIYDDGSGYFDFESYADLGILVDFYELIEEDPELDAANYCENVFRAFEYEGGLYQLVTSFRINTMLGKASIFGEEDLTWERLSEILNEYPEASVFRDTFTRRMVLNYAMIYGYDEFVDEKNGTCDFTGEEFKSLLAFVARYPEEIDYEALYSSDDNWENYDQQYIMNRVLLYSGTMYNLSYWRDYYYYEFMEDVVATGFPNNNGVKGVIYPVSCFGISSKSASQDGAWEFVRSFITEEAQTPEEGEYYYGVPILKTSVEQQVMTMTERPYYLDDNGEKVFYDYTVWVGDEEVVVDPATEEEAAYWLDFIYSVDHKAGSAEDDIFNIIFEEAEAYFNGQKTVDEVCEIIQSRMSIYISESQ